MILRETTVSIGLRLWVLLLSIGSLLLPATSFAGEGLFWWFPDEAEDQLWDGCSSGLSSQRLDELKSMDRGRSIQWLEQNCSSAKTEIRSHAWRAYVDCKPRLTPAQGKEFESSTWDARTEFLVAHCQPAAQESAEVVETPAPAAEPETGAQDSVSDGTPKIAVLGIVDDTGIDPGDLETLGGIIERVLVEESRDRYRLLEVEPTLGEPCDESCMIGKAREMGVAYVVTGQVSAFAGGYVLSLSLRSAEGSSVLAGAETDAVELTNLPMQTRTAAKLLVPGGPFGAPRSEPDSSVVVVEEAPAERLYPGSYLVDMDSPGESDWRVPDRNIKAPRIAAHVLFWLGLDAGLGGMGMSIVGADDAAIVLYITGGTLMITGGICAIVYWKRKRDSTQPVPGEEADLIAAPILTPSFAGFGLSKSF